MWSYNNQNELYHYGVKGMKWGVRHDKQSSSSRPQYATKAMEREMLRQTKAMIDYSSGTRNENTRNNTKQSYNNHSQKKTIYN